MVLCLCADFETMDLAHLHPYHIVSAALALPMEYTYVVLLLHNHIQPCTYTWKFATFEVPLSLLYVHTCSDVTTKASRYATDHSFAALLTQTYNLDVSTCTCTCSMGLEFLCTALAYTL